MKAPKESSSIQANPPINDEPSAGQSALPAVIRATESVPAPADPTLHSVRSFQSSARFVSFSAQVASESPPLFRTLAVPNKPLPTPPVHFRSTPVVFTGTACSIESLSRFITCRQPIAASSFSTAAASHDVSAKTLSFSVSTSRKSALDFTEREWLSAQVVSAHAAQRSLSSQEEHGSFPFGPHFIFYDCTATVRSFFFPYNII